jgi:hypothetical protein
MAETNNTHQSGTSYGYCENYGESEGDRPTLLEIFAEGPEFENFKKHLRQAAQLLTVADFVRLRKSYDAAWLNVIAEL